VLKTELCLIQKKDTRESQEFGVETSTRDLRKARRSIVGIHESREPAAENAGFVSGKILDPFHFLQIANLCQSMAISVANIGP